MFSASFTLYPSTKQKQNVKPVTEARDGIHSISCIHLSHSGWKQQAKLSEFGKRRYESLCRSKSFSPLADTLKCFLKKQTNKQNQTTNIFQYSTDLSHTPHPHMLHVCGNLLSVPPFSSSIC